MTLWALHITGSDDLIAMPSEEEARQLKASCDLMDDVEASPLLGARVVEWPYSPEAHAKQLREAAGDG